MESDPGDRILNIHNELNISQSEFTSLSRDYQHRLLELTTGVKSKDFDYNADPHASTLREIGVTCELERQKISRLCKNILLVVEQPETLSKVIIIVIAIVLYFVQLQISFLIFDNL